MYKYIQGILKHMPSFLVHVTVHMKKPNTWIHAFDVGRIQRIIHMHERQGEEFYIKMETLNVIIHESTQE